MAAVSQCVGRAWEQQYLGSICFWWGVISSSRSCITLWLLCLKYSCGRWGLWIKKSLEKGRCELQWDHSCLYLCWNSHSLGEPRFLSQQSFALRLGSYQHHWSTQWLTVNFPSLLGRTEQPSSLLKSFILSCSNSQDTQPVPPWLSLAQLDKTQLGLDPCSKRMTSCQ